MALEKIMKNSSGVPTGEYERIAGGTLWADSPIGTILAYGGTTAPAGWMICDGTSLLRASYPELFAVIGTAFGSADSTHFNIPDLRGEFLRGAGTNSHSGQGDGGTVGEHQDATEIPNILIAAGNRIISEDGGGTNEVANADSFASDSQQYFSESLTKDSTNTRRSKYSARPTNTSVNYIIKAVQVALPADLASGVEEYVDENFGVVDVSSGKTVTITVGGTAVIKTDTNDLRTYVPFPFMTKDINYSATFSNVAVDGIAGDVSSACSVVAKYKNGMKVKIANNADGVRLLHSLTVTITF